MKYTVTIQEIWEKKINIEAASKNEAELLAMAQYSDEFAGIEHEGMVYEEDAKKADVKFIATEGL